MKQQKFALKEHEHKDIENILITIITVGFIIFVGLIILNIQQDKRLSSLESQLNQTQENQTQEDCCEIDAYVNPLGFDDEYLNNYNFLLVHCSIGTKTICEVEK